MTVKIVHLADAHLGGPMERFGDYAATRRQERDQAFRRAVGVALEERAHAVVIAGDLFDTWSPDAAARNLAAGELARLREAGIPVLGVPGLRDSLTYRDSVYRVESLPFHHFFTGRSFADPVALEVDGVRVTFYGVAGDPDRQEGVWESLERRDGEGIHVAIAHAARRSDREGTAAGPEALPFDEEDLVRSGMDWVALGHDHDHVVFEAEGGPVGAYPGSIEGIDWSETGPRYVLVVTWEEAGAPPEVRPVEVHSRALDTAGVDVTGISDQTGIAEAVRAACDPAGLWSVTLTGEPETVPRPRQIEAELEAVYGHLVIRDGTTLVGSRILHERCEEETVRGEFFRRLASGHAGTEEGRAREVADRAIKVGLRVFG